MFLYFFPGFQTIDQAAIDAAGMRYALGRNEWQTRAIVVGPGQQGGLMVCRSNVPLDRMKFDAGRQQWRKIPKRATYCGRWSDISPTGPRAGGEGITPTMLERPMQCSGHPVTLADEQVWNVAMARKFIEVDQQSFYYNALPHELDLGDDGEWTASTVAFQYARLSKLADMYWTAQSKALESDSDSFTFNEIDDLAVESITANYYVAAIELAMLKAYSLQVRAKIIEATLDQLFVKTMLQKKTDAAHDGSDSEPGVIPTQPEKIPATLQPSAS